MNETCPHCGKPLSKKPASLKMPRRKDLLPLARKRGNLMVGQERWKASWLV